MKNENRQCQNCKKDFVIETEEFNFYERVKVPPPTWCPECRAMRRLIWRNERSLYHNKCAFSGKDIISMFAPETGLTVYDRDIWWGDKWDPLAYGEEYDFSKTFFEQYRDLMYRIPLANLGNTNSPGSEYGNHNEDCRNCYLLYASFRDENCHYSNGLVDVKDSWDLYKVGKSQKCYNSTLCTSCYNTNFSYDSDECIDSMFLTSCLGLKNCLGCINLRHKKHCIFNEQYSEEEYKQKIAEYDFGSYAGLKKFEQEYNDFLAKQFRRYAFVFKSVNSTGDNIMFARNSRMLFDGFDDIENCRYITHAVTIKDSYDAYGTGGKMELLYEGIDAGLNAYNMHFCILTHSCVDTDYTYMCFDSNHLFGCIGLRNQDYCILNKKYSKEEYHKLREKIIEHMNAMPYVDAQGRVYGYGEFFPTEFSPFYYNETIAEEYYPLTEEEAKGYGFKWKEKEKRDYKIKIKAEDLPDHIKDVDEFIVDKVIGCLHAGTCNEQCTEAFKIREDELKFYKYNNLALPRLCPNCGHFGRLKKRNPLKLWHRQCMCDKVGHEHEGVCTNEFETSYAPERPEIVYCEKCYQKEVY
ncbi:MAG: hypothetical protein WC783_05105 [Candidatus Paceibacterota bacterium]|jgi:hypothetical protein